jgi:hypothetical protein
MDTKTFWLSFRLADDASYDRRYDELIDAVRQRASKWWLESSSFIVFASAHGIDSIAAAIKAAVNERTDVVIIGMPDFKSARLIGGNDNDIFDLMPFIQRA